MVEEIMIIILAFFFVTGLPAQNAEDIIRKMDELQTFDTIIMTGTMVSVDQFGKKTTTFKSWSAGNDKFLVELTGGNEAGQKVLKLKDELYLYYPDAEEIIPLYGSALKQSMFGDISYEDMTEGNDTLSKYNVVLLATEKVDGRDCYKIEMTAKTKDVPYARQIIWVDSGSYVLRQGEYYAKSGPALKKITVLEVKNINGKYILSSLKLINLKKSDTWTEMKAEDIKIDEPIPEQKFSVGSLSF